MRWLLVILLLTSVVAKKKKQEYTPLPEDILDIVMDHAPRIYLHSQEKYLPSDVDFALKDMYVTYVSNNQAVPGQPSPLTRHNLGNVLPGKSDTARLTSKEDLKYYNEPAPRFVRGQKPNATFTPESYALVVPKKNGVIDIFYFQFYPYNYGKDVCLGADNRNNRKYRKRGFGSFLRKVGGKIADAGKKVGNAIVSGGKKVGNVLLDGGKKAASLIGKILPKNCLGVMKSFGHHVGDWEHLTLRLVNGEPDQYYFSAHNFGGAKKYSAAHDEFDSIDDHLVIYAALGSHGVYGSSGKHVYQKLPTGGVLADVTDKGTAWDTWKNLNVIFYKPNGQYTGKDNWLNFLGDWGNKEGECGISIKKDLYDKVAGQCVLNGGPSGIPSKGWAKPDNQELS